MAAVLLALVFLIPFFSAQNFSPASDEVTHLPSGYSYWKTSQITLNPQHPPLVKLLASLPLLFMDLKFDRQDPNLSGPLKNEWTFGRNFLFSNDVGRLLLWGRLSVMLMSVLLGFYIFRWASEMFSQKAGLLALFIYAFTPNIIAHAQFVTTDLALASFSFISLYYLWKSFRTKFRKYLIYSGLFMGLALSSKFSAVFMLMPATFLLIIHSWRGPSRSNFSIRQCVYALFVWAAPVFIVIYSVYFFPSDLDFYLKGLKTVYADWKPNYSFYLNGQFSPNGWWYYFLYAFLIKTPVPALIAFIFSVLLYKKLHLDKWDKMFVFLPMLFFTFITSIKAHDAGIRYLIPAFPFLILYTGGLADIIKIKWHSLKSRILVLTVIGLASWLVFSSITSFPDYLAYFNELVGGPKNGYKYLDDSNIEWGQDLKRLRDYQIKNPGTKIAYSWNKLSPEYYGINNLIPLNGANWWGNPKGLYAVNTFLLIRMQYLSTGRKDPSLNWLSLYKPVDRIGYSFFVYEFN